jgi:hypothetical protein
LYENTGSKNVKPKIVSITTANAMSTGFGNKPLSVKACEIPTHPQATFSIKISHDEHYIDLASPDSNLLWNRFGA